MKISPYLENLLKRWGNEKHRDKPWHSECPSFKEFIGTTTRAPVLVTESDEVEMVGLWIQQLSQPLRKALEAKYKHHFKTNAARANWCRCTKEEYNAHLREAWRKLTDFEAVGMTG